MITAANRCQRHDHDFIFHGSSRIQREIRKRLEYWAKLRKARNEP